MFRYVILGPIGLSDSERPLPVGGPRQVALLALLLVHANRVVSSDQLIDALWGRQSPATALKRLHVAISRLRKTLDVDGVSGEPVLRTVAGGYLLGVQPGDLDASVFQVRMRDGRRALEAGDARRARAVLGEALAMWRGPALAEVTYEDFAQPEIRRLEELRLASLEAWADAGLQLGEHGALIAELDALVAAHPGRERLAAQLMLALYRCGRQKEALEVYAATRAYLSGELGLEPGPALKTIHAEVLAQCPALQHVADDRVAGAPAVERAHVAEGRVRLPLPRALHVAPTSPFVGRAPELARLRERWAEVCGGARAAVFVAGEAGIGKTRLAAQLACDLQRDGALVLYGRCDEGLGVPYQPFVEAVRPYASALGSDGRRVQLGPLAPQLGRLLPELEAPGDTAGGDPESERFALFEAVSALIEAATRKVPVLLILDDLHWAAGPTLLLVRHLIRSERPLRALVLGTYRETELDPGDALGQLLADLQRDSSVQTLSVRGLDEAAITVLLEAAANHTLDDRAAEFVQVLRGQTAGNPFFIRELLAHLVESGAIYRTGQRWTSDLRPAQLEIPEGLRAVIRHRVARLSKCTRQALTVAAVAGPTFSVALLEHVLGEEPVVLDALDEAVAAGLLAEAGPAAYAFAHALVRQALYAELGSARRMRVHRKLGEALEALADRDADVEALAYHFAQAAADGQGDKATTYALTAARSATARLGYEEAVAHCERGLEALEQTEPPDQERRCELLLALGHASWTAGYLDKGRQAYEQAAELAERLGDATALAHAALGFCGPPRFELATAVNRRPVAGMLRRALAALGNADSALRAQLIGRLVNYTDTEQQRPVLARQALQMARRVGEKGSLADVLASTHWAMRGPDAFEEPMALAGELGRLAEELGDDRLRATAHWRLVDFLLELGDIDAVKREIEALHRLAQTRRERYVNWLSIVVQANHAYLEGRLEDCERLAHDAFAHCFAGHDELAAQVFAAHMFFIRIQQGRLDEIMEAVENAVERHPELPVWRCGLVYVYARLQRKAQARQEFERLARTNFSSLPRNQFWLWSLSQLSEGVVSLGDAPRAHLLYKLLLPYADRYAVAFELLGDGSVSRSLGLLATMLSRYELAERHFEHALTMNARTRSPIWTAHTQHDYAHMLVRRDHRGDRDSALQLLSEALSTSHKLGLTALADNARELKSGAEMTGTLPTVPHLT